MKSGKTLSLEEITEMFTESVTAAGRKSLYTNIKVVGDRLDSENPMWTVWYNDASNSTLCFGFRYNIEKKMFYVYSPKMETNNFYEILDIAKKRIAGINSF